jgi:multiple sugar transport system substrate-binding protein
MIHQSGGKMLDPSGTKAGFEGEPGKKAMEYFRRFVTEGGMPLIDFDSSRAQFTAGQMGIHFDTPARLRVISDQIGNKFTLGTEVFPIDNKGGGGIPTGGSAIIITAKDPAKQKAAWEYAKFLTGPEAQKVVVEVTGYLPTNKLATGPQYLGAFYQANPHFATATRQTDRAVPWQGYPGGNSVRVWRTQREVITGVMRGEIAPEAGLEKLVKETNALIK